MYWTSSPRFGTGWTSESTHRTAICSFAGTRSWVCISVIVVSLGLRLLCGQLGRNVYAVEPGGVAPAHLFALLGGERAGQLTGIPALPMRIARAEHHHVFLAGEAEPLVGELGVTGRAVQTAGDEVHMPGQVVTRDSRRPRRLLEVRTAEGVHPPDE